MVLLALLLSAAGVSQEADRFRIKEGFRIELVHDVTSAGHGSWVCLTADPKGRLITSDQYGGLYRVTLDAGRSRVERIDLPVGGAQGLCWAGGSLYAVVATLERVRTFGIVGPRNASRVARSDRTRRCFRHCVWGINHRCDRRPQAVATSQAP